MGQVESSELLAWCEVFCVSELTVFAGDCGDGGWRAVLIGEVGESEDRHGVGSEG